MPMGPQGIDVDATESLLVSLQARGVHPKILYTIPTFQNPTGLTIPEGARVALLDLARRYNLVVIEDDAYRDLYYDACDGPLPSSFYKLDREGRVIRTGTFSKILTPGMRLGWAIAQPAIIQKMLLLKEEGGTVPFSQHVAVEYARDGALTEHIAALVDAYRAKRDAMLTALDRYFRQGRNGHARREASSCGSLFRQPSTLASWLRLARKEGVEYLPGESCFAQPPSMPGTYLRLSFSLLSVDEIEEAIVRLGRVIGSLL